MDRATASGGASEYRLNMGNSLPGYAFHPDESVATVPPPSSLTKSPERPSMRSSRGQRCTQTGSSSVEGPHVHPGIREALDPDRRVDLRSLPDDECANHAFLGMARYRTEIAVGAGDVCGEADRRRVHP